MTAGIIYVFQRKDLYPLGRAAVFMGLLSYTFVTVTLMADLGLPLHSYQLALNAPEHSAMFEVSWCIAMYVTVLLFEFLPVPFEHFGMKRAMELWRRWSGVMGHARRDDVRVPPFAQPGRMPPSTAAIFGTMAWTFRARGEKFEPVILAIAAVSLSAMHQSSLGSLFLLMPDQVPSQWWSPVMPISFFLSSIAAGQRAHRLDRNVDLEGMAPPAVTFRASRAMGQITFWSLLVYLVFRLGDMAVRDQLGQAFAEGTERSSLAEIVLGGIVPLCLLARASTRARPGMLLLGTLLAAAGIVLNRANVVLFAMNVHGPMPWTAPDPYSPSIIEWARLDRPHRHDDLPLRVRRPAPPAPPEAGRRRGASDRWRAPAGSRRIRTSSRWRASMRSWIPRCRRSTSSMRRFRAGTITWPTSTTACRSSTAKAPRSSASRRARWRAR